MDKKYVTFLDEKNLKTLGNKEKKDFLPEGI